MTRSKIVQKSALAGALSLVVILSAVLPVNALTSQQLSAHVFTKPFYVLSVSPDYLTIRDGSSSQATLTITPYFGWSGKITIFGISSSGIKATTSTHVVSVLKGHRSSATITISVPISVIPGTYVLLVNGWDGKQTSLVPVAITVTPPPATLSGNPTMTPRTGGAIPQLSPQATKILSYLDNKPSIIVQNADTGDPNQMSLTYEDSTIFASKHVKVNILINNILVVSKTLSYTNGDTGPQNVALSSFSNSAALQYGFDSVQIETYPDGMIYPKIATASFVLTHIWVDLRTDLVAEYPLIVDWNLMETFPINKVDPSQSPDQSTITSSVSLNGNQIYPTTQNPTISNNYGTYNPDSTNPAYVGYYGYSKGQEINIPALDPSTVGLPLDTPGSTVDVKVTATLADQNPSAVFPISPGPYVGVIHPLVLGQIPKFPVNYGETDPLGSARWMTTAVQVHSDGSIEGNTTFNDANWVTGYKGGAVVVFYDHEGNILYNTPIVTDGLSGTCCDPESKTDYWTAQIQPAVRTNLIGYVKIYQMWTPGDATTEINNWLATAKTAAGVGAAIVAVA